MPERPAALITGASGGLGRHLARAFAAAGYDLLLQCRSAHQQLAELAAELAGGGARVQVAAVDLTAPGSIGELFAGLGDRRLQALVNNAGVYPAADFMSTDEADWATTMALNVIAPFECIKAAADRMEAGASIVNVGSIAAHRAHPDQAPYAASKAALLSLTRSAALALATRGIRVNAVSPGLVARTDIEEAWPDGVDRWRARAPMGALIRAEDVAGLCVFLAGRGSSMITGQEYVIDGGTTVAPDY